MYKRFLISGSRPLAARLGAGAGRRQQRRGYQAQASSSSGEAGNVAQRAVGDLSKWLLVGPLAGVLGGGAAFALSRQEAGLETVSHEHYEASKRSHPWVQAICDEPGTQLVSHGPAGGPVSCAAAPSVRSLWQRGAPRACVFGCHPYVCFWAGRRPRQLQLSVDTLPGCELQVLTRCARFLLTAGADR